MKEIVGELWDYYKKLNTVILITTNGFVKKNGCGVMGRGCALEASQRIKQFPALLGYHIQKNGNVPMRVPGEPILTFPVKHSWWEQADLKLIKRSAEWLAGCDESYTYVLPRPGCGNGKLDWPTVKRVLESAELQDNVWVISHGSN